MQIRLDVEGIESGRVFTPSERITGSVRLRLQEVAVVTDVTITLEGSVRTSVIKQVSGSVITGDAPTVTNETHKLVKVSKVLFPRGNVPSPSGGYTLSEGEYDFPFEISYPLAPRCAALQPELRHVAAVLPPSFEAHAAGPGALANIEYIIKAEVKKPGRLRRGVSIQRKLIFQPLDPDPVPLLHMGWGSGYYARQAALYMSDLPTGISAIGCPRSLPILLLEGRLPFPPILFPRSSLPLRLFVRSLPAPRERLLAIKMQSLAVTLRSTTNIRAGTHREKFISSRRLLDLKGLKGIISCTEDTEVLSEIKIKELEDVIVPNVTPSFTTCTVEQECSLEVRAGFSLGETTKLTLIKVVVNVEIWSGLGASQRLYTTSPGDIGASEDRTPPDPFRPGFLAHLGITELGTEARGPPPY